MKIFQKTVFPIIMFILLVPIISFADSYNVVGPKGTQYIGDGEISLTWNKDKVVDLIALENYKEENILMVHAWKVRGDQPILDGKYSLSDNYDDLLLQNYMENGGKYRLHLEGPDGVDFYSDWFIALWGKSNNPYSKKLDLSISPNKINKNQEALIRFNDVGADYYLLTASCKDSVNVGGKARPDLCIEGEKIYPTGKDVILVRDFYPTTSGTSSTFQIEVSAFTNGKVVKTDYEDVEVTSYGDYYDDDLDEPEDDDKYDDEHEDDNNKEYKDVDLSASEISFLIETIFGKNSDVYKFIQLLIQVGVIK